MGTSIGERVAPLTQPVDVFTMAVGAPARTLRLETTPRRG